MRESGSLRSWPADEMDVPHHPPIVWAGCLHAAREALDDAAAVHALVRAGMRTRAVDPAQSLWVIDLAPGDGERAWRVMGELRRRALRGPRVRYLAIAHSVAQCDALCAHPQLQELIADGDLRIGRAPEICPPNGLCNPVVVLAHDALAACGQAVLSYRRGELTQAQVSDDGGLVWRAERRDGVFRLASAYRNHGDEMAFTLPHGAMDAMATLLRASGGRMLLRSCGVGTIDHDALQRAGTAAASLPKLANYDAMMRWHRANDGVVHQYRTRHDGRVMHVALHEAGGGDLCGCLPEVLALPHPDDHVDLLDALSSLSDPPPSQCLALLRAHDGDPRAVAALRVPLSRAVEATSSDGVAAVADALAWCERQRYVAMNGSTTHLCDSTPAVDRPLMAGGGDA